jgi:hypothetical protein
MIKKKFAAILEIARNDLLHKNMFTTPPANIMANGKTLKSLSLKMRTRYGCLLITTLSHYSPGDSSKSKQEKH